MGVIAAPLNKRGASLQRRRRDGKQSVAVVGRMEDQEGKIMQPIPRLLILVQPLH
jgi:hypothetical protein